MKINLAESMLRFGAKNLTSNNVKKLEQISEQKNIEDDPTAFTVPGTSIKFIINNTSNNSDGSARTMWAQFTPPTTSPDKMSGTLTFNSPSMRTAKLSKTNAAITHEGFMLNSKNYDSGNMTSIDLVYHVAKTLFGEAPNQNTVEETVRGLMYARDQLQKDFSPGAQMIADNITKILRVCFRIAQMDYMEFLSLKHKSGGYIDGRSSNMIYNACRIILGLPLDAAKINADPAYREKLKQDKLNKQNQSPNV